MKKRHAPLLLTALLWLANVWAQDSAPKTKPGKPAADPQTTEEKTAEEKTAEEKAAAKAGEKKPEEAAGKKSRRTMLVTDQKGNTVALTQVQLKSGSFWTYEGLRVKRSEPAPRPQAREDKIKNMKMQLDQRTRGKRENIARPMKLSQDTVVKWDEIKEVEILKTVNEKNAAVLYNTRIVTTRNDLIEERIKSPSDHLTGTTEDKKKYSIPLKNIRKIAFAAEDKKKAGARAPNPVRPQTFEQMKATSLKPTVKPAPRSAKPAPPPAKTSSPAEEPKQPAEEPKQKDPDQ